MFLQRVPIISVGHDGEFRGKDGGMHLDAKVPADRIGWGEIGGNRSGVESACRALTRLPTAALTGAPLRTCL